MKKYLNKSIFYHGDINLLLLFIAVSGAWWIISNMAYRGWYHGKVNILYYSDGLYDVLPLTGIYMVMYIALISITFFILTGNKRKKWRLQLADRFTRKDIRNREMILMYGLVGVFALIFLVSSIIYIIQNYAWIQYTTVVYEYLFVNLGRIIIIGFTLISGLFLIDSLVINNISCFGLISFLSVYSISMLSYILSMLAYNIYLGDGLLSVYINKLMSQCSIWFRIVFEGYIYDDISINLILPLAIILVFGIIFFIGSRLLISKIKIENMNGFFVVNFDRRIVIGIVSTFISLILTVLLSIFMDVTLFIMIDGITNILMFTVISVIIYIILQKRNKIIMALIKK